MTQSETVIGTWLVSVLEQFEAQGVSTRNLAEASWLREASARNPTRPLKMVAVRRLWHQAMKAGDSPLLGVRVGASLPLQAMNVTAWVAIHSPDLRHSLRNAVRFQGLVSSSGRSELIERSDGLRLSYHVTPSPVSMHPAQVDSVFSGILRLLRNCRSVPLRPTAMGLPGALPAVRHHYEQLLDCDVTESIGPAYMEFSLADLDTPYPAADPHLLQLAIRRAEDMLHAQGRTESLVDHVQATILSQGLTNAQCSAVAGVLCMSVRTLQRRLEACGTNYRRVLEATRMEEAIRLFGGSSLSLANIAELLGYADLSALSHAVRAHWGTSPRNLRKEVARGDMPDARASTLQKP